MTEVPGGLLEAARDSHNENYQDVEPFIVAAVLRKLAENLRNGMGIYDAQDLENMAERIENDTQGQAEEGDAGAPGGTVPNGVEEAPAAGILDDGATGAEDDHADAHDVR